MVKADFIDRSYGTNCKYILKIDIFNKACNWLFGISTSTVTLLKERGSGYVLQGCTKEGSHYVYAIMLMIIMLWATYELTHKGLRWIIISIILMVVSMSFSSILYIAVVGTMLCMYWIRKSNTVQIKCIKCIIVGGVCLLVVIITLSNISSITSSFSETSFGVVELKV